MQSSACSTEAQVHAAVAQTRYAASKPHELWLTNMHCSHMMWSGHERTCWNCRHSSALVSSTLMQTSYPIFSGGRRMRLRWRCAQSKQLPC